MASNRKLTDFFRPAAALSIKRPRSLDSSDDTIIVAQPADQSPGSLNSNTVSRRSRLHEAGTESEHVDKGAPDLRSSPIDQPSSSQSLPSHGNQRIVKNGKTIIRSSDDEESDLDSLDDLNDLLAPQRPPVGADRHLDQNSSTLKVRSRSRRQENSSSIAPSVTPNYKFSLDSLVERTVEDVASEAGVAEARAILGPASMRSQRQSGEQTGHTTPGMSRGGEHAQTQLIASVMNESAEDGHYNRILHAIERTDALYSEKGWYFFEDGPTSETEKYNTFPIKTIHSDAWRGVLNDPASMQQSFLSGFVRDMAPMIPLPDEMMLWILEELSFEPRIDLRQAYISTCKSCEAQMQSLLQPPRIRKLFQNLGATSEAVDLTQKAIPRSRKAHGLQEYDWSRTVSVITLLGTSADYLTTEAREQTICILARLSLDPSVVDDGNVLVAIEDALTLLIGAVPEREVEDSLSRVGRILVSFVQDPPMRYRLICSLPAFPSRHHTFRRRLALTYFFNDDLNYLTKPLDSLLRLPDIITYLLRPSFCISKDTNYSELAALISILDIGIDDGACPSTTSRTIEEEDDFNSDVDELARSVKRIFTSIVDTGASHMPRTVAKEVLERVHYRLVYAVRTKEKAKKSIFDSGTLSSREGSDAFARFFSKSKNQSGGVESG
ncbi:MAG: hypothetical protein M1819_004100 [Sarea resinae]|nr:MAG: hypothetical protein M1819_004100 [Sarea resinae]